MTFQKIAFAGATGYLGSKVLSHLLTIPTIEKFTILTRSDSAHTFPSHSLISVTPIPSYDDQEAVAAALSGHDLLISTLAGAVSDEMNPVLVSAAISAGVQRFMPSEYTLDVMHPHAIAVAGSTILAHKIRNARSIQELAEKGEIEYTTIVVAGILDWWFKNGNLGVDLKRKKVTLYDGGENRATGTTTDFIAQCIGAVVRSPAETTKNRRIRVAEAEYSGKELLRAFERATGEKWEVEEKSTEVLLEEGRKACENGDMRGFYLGHVLKLNFDGGGAAFFEEGLKQWEDCTSRSSFQDIVKRAI